jgi:1,5-anhydro-D-fructose reductase (1,5-anhydro-D-mannitol-forming)
VKPAVAFVGLGVMGHRMLTNMTTHGGFDVAMAWDPDPQTCCAVEQHFAGVRIGSSAHQVVADPAIDVVYIASPPDSHREYVTAAAAAGKTVFCEKPLGINVAESRSLVETVEASGILNAVNFPFADTQAINMIQARLEDGSIGEVTGVDVRLHFSKWPRDWQDAASWLSLRKEGGFVREVGSHYVFLVEKLLGPAVLIDASVHFPVDGSLCETHFLARLDCNGIPVSLAGGAGGVGPDTVEFTVWGTKISYRLWDWNRLKSSRGGGWRDELTDLRDPRQDGYMRVLENFLGMLKGNPHSMPPLRAALTVQEIVEGILTH